MCCSLCVVVCYVVSAWLLFVDCGLLVVARVVCCNLVVVFVACWLLFVILS